MTSAVARWLLGLLAAQLVLVAITWWPAETPSRPAGPLLSFSAAAVDQIRISDGSDTVVLRRLENAWRLGQPNGPAADADRVASLLATLGRLRGDWPVAASESSHARFEVADDQYLRRVELFAGEARLAALRVGRSPGLGQAYVRVGEQTRVYPAEISVFELGVKDADWRQAEPAEPDASGGNVHQSEAG